MSKEISTEEFLGLLEKEKDSYHFLPPISLNGACLKLGAEEIKLPPFPQREDFKTMRAWHEALDRYYRLGREPHLSLKTAPQGHYARFVMEHNFQNLVVKRIGDFKYEEFVAWIHEQARERWSVKAFMDVDNRPGRSFLVFYFESDRDATLFKLFNF